MITRRAFLRTALATAGALAAAGCGPATQRPADDRQSPADDRQSPAATLPRAPAAASAADAPLPSVELIALGRLGYGPRPGDAERVAAMGLAAYLDEQLQPDDADDPGLSAALAAATLQISHGGGGAFPPTDEARPLRHLDDALADLWPLADWDSGTPYEEMWRPVDELRAAMVLRAVHSRWQLREVLVSFWHDHFNVNAGGDDNRIAVTWPLYDRDVIRRHALGNFRALLEAVATSQAMLYSLSNATSRTGPANENYARELFELHTLGAEHYLNDRYEQWSEVPGAREGRAEGYLDDDVYEAARAFTGWTVADGAWLADETSLPNTGEFTYVDAWHDVYQKRILGVELPSHAPPMADGRAVLDILAAHPATARHMAAKLCRRLVADDPPPALVERATAAWSESIDAEDQIAQVVRAIVLAPEFAATWGEKLRRPFEVLAAFCRATAADVRPDGGMFWMLAEYGQDLFAWPAPNGLPDRADYWLSTNATLGRWSLPSALALGWTETRLDLWGQTPADATAREIAEHWTLRLLGAPAAPELAEQLAALMAQDGSPDAPPAFDDDEDRAARLASLVALIAMLPPFQLK